MLANVTFTSVAAPEPTSLRVVEEAWKHTVIEATFLGPAPGGLRSGEPALVEWGQGQQHSRTLPAYVNHVEPIDNGGTPATRVILLGATYPLKESHQRQWPNVTLKKVVGDVAKASYLRSEVFDDGSVYSTVTQAGEETDWELLVRLTKEAGLLLVPYGTNILVRDPQEYLSRSWSQAPILSRNANTTDLTVFKSEAEVGDTLRTALADSGSYSVGRNGSIAHRGSKKANTFSRTLARPGESGKDAKVHIARAQRKQQLHQKGRATVMGWSSLYPSEGVLFSDYSVQMNGYWVVTKAEHRVTQKTYATNLELARGSASGSGVTAAVASARSHRVPTLAKPHLVAGKWRG